MPTETWTPRGTLSEATTAAYKVKAEVMEAYYDCHKPDAPESGARRSLVFRASGSLSPDDAIRVLNSAGVDSYNDFRSKFIAGLPLGCRVTIGRQYSPAIYVFPAIPVDMHAAIAKAMKADDILNQPGPDGREETYIWWD